MFANLSYFKDDPSELAPRFLRGAVKAPPTPFVPYPSGSRRPAQRAKVHVLVQGVQADFLLFAVSPSPVASVITIKRPQTLAVS